MSTYNATETGRMAEVHGMLLATFQQRAGAFLIDFLFSFIFFLIFAVGGAIIGHQFGWVSGEIKLVFGFKSWYALIIIVLYFSVFLYFGKGQTPGKRIFNIRVVSLVHDHISLWHSIERALGYAASALEFGFGFLQYFIHPNKRTVHDRIAETIVVQVTKKK
jgi:uncharacterized RDD family membrane protein YckC